jgi:hypothetical protein
MAGGTIVIGASWREGIRKALDAVLSSGQAAAAIQEADDFAGNVSDEVGGGGFGFFTADPWRSAAAKQIDDARRQVVEIADVYTADSSLPVGGDWPTHRARIMDLYNLAQVIRQGYPEEEDGSGLDDVLTRGLVNLPSVIAGAPGAIVHASVNLAGEVLDGAKTVVKKAGGVVTEAASVVSGAVTSIVPWPVVIGGVIVAGGLIFGIAYLAKSGVKVSVPL